MPPVTSSQQPHRVSLSSRRGLRDALWLVLALIPPALTAALTTHYWVDAHLADEWNQAVYFDKFARGILTLNDLFKLQNEYRQFFPNLIFVAVGWLTHWDVRYWMALSFLAAFIVSFNIYWLERRTLNLTRAQRLGLYCISNLLIFSPVQYENWMQGQQLIYFFPIVCVTACFVICLSKRLSLKTKFVLCSAAATVATFSSANGLTCWLVALPVLLLSTDAPDRSRQRRRLTVLWVVILAANLFFYLYRYRNTPGHPSLLTSVWKPTHAAAYFLSLLGSPLAFALPTVIAIASGLVVLALFLWLCVDLLKRQDFGDVEMRRRLCWLLLGAYSILSALLITVARLGFGVGQSRSARYITFTLYLVVALIHLLSIKFLEPHAEKHRIYKLLSRRVVVAVVSGILLLHAGYYALTIRHYSNLQIRFVQSKACVPFVNVIESDDCATINFLPLDTLKSYANAVDALGFIRPGLLRTNRIQDIESGYEASGSFDTLSKSASGEYIASGWALLPNRGEPPDAVLLVYEQPHQPGTIFAIAYVNANRDYVSQLVGRGTYGDSRWNTKLRIDIARLGGATVSAWAYDLDTAKAHRLRGSFVVPLAESSANNQ